MAKLHVLLFAVLGVHALIYDFSTSTVTQLNPNNFDRQVTKSRDRLTSIVHFYKDSDSQSKSIATALNSLAKDWQGAFIVAAVDCRAHSVTCEKEDVSETPVVKVYPPYPVPVQVYSGEMSDKGLLGHVSKYLQGDIKEVTDDNYDMFLAEKPSMPKVILFSEKKGLPTLFKGLAVAFDGKMIFGIVRPEAEAVQRKFKVRSYPKLVVSRTDKPLAEYSGELNFKEIFDFVNIYSETFVPGGKAQSSSLGAKPWNEQSVPELFKLSADDICFGKDGALCGILLSNEAPSEAQVNAFRQLKEKYSVNSEGRGLDLRFMWLDVAKEPQFSQAFAPVQVPELVFLKYGKRNRFIKHEGALDKDSIDMTLNKITGGEGKFTNLKSLPDLSSRK
jgi:thioredoxin-like negative regulator of GroEL